MYRRCSAFATWCTFCDHCYPSRCAKIDVPFTFTNRAGSNSSTGSISCASHDRRPFQQPKLTGCLSQQNSNLINGPHQGGELLRVKPNITEDALEPRLLIEVNSKDRRACPLHNHVAGAPINKVAIDIKETTHPVVCIGLFRFEPEQFGYAILSTQSGACKQCKDTSVNELSHHPLRLPTCPVVKPDYCAPEQHPF
ncbi:hypothetical protein ES703_112064 [subsurface metagenome]